MNVLASYWSHEFEYKDAALRQSRFLMVVYPGSLKIRENFLAGSDWADSVARVIQSGCLIKEDREKLTTMTRDGSPTRRFACLANAGLEQARAIIATKIINILDERKLSAHDAKKLTGVSHSEFFRIRNAPLRRFTLDRMIAVLDKLDEDVEVNVTFTPRRHGTHATPRGR